MPQGGLLAQTGGNGDKLFGAGGGAADPRERKKPGDARRRTQLVGNRTGNNREHIFGEQEARTQSLRARVRTRCGGVVARVAVVEGDIGATIGNGFEGGIRCCFAEFDVDARKLSIEAREQRRDDAGNGGGEGGEANGAAVEPEVGGEVAGGGGDGGVDAGGVAREEGAGFGEFHAARGARDEGDVQASFAALELLGDGGLAESQATSCG